MKQKIASMYEDSMFGRMTSIQAEKVKGLVRKEGWLLNYTSNSDSVYLYKETGGDEPTPSIHVTRSGAIIRRRSTEHSLLKDGAWPRYTVAECLAFTEPQIERDRREALSLEPKYDHSCPSCQYLGSWHGTLSGYIDGRTGDVDLYECRGETVICRYSSDPPDYSSGIGFVEMNPALTVAYARALELGVKFKYKPGRIGRQETYYNEGDDPYLREWETDEEVTDV